MSIELKVPAVGESITEVEIGEWLKQEGDLVKKDENIVVIETEKATVELPSPASGVIERILKRKGQAAAVGEIIGFVDVGTKKGPARAEAAESGKKEPEAPAAKGAAEADPSAKVMPSAARVLAESGLRAEEVTPTGPGGRLLKEDVVKESSQRAAGAGSAEVAAAAPAPAPVSKGVASGGRQEEAVRMSKLRRTVASRLLAAQNNAALLTTFNEIDMSNVMSLRKEHGEAFQKKYGTKLGFMSFFVKATIDGLKQVPQLNAEIRGEDIIYKNYFDIGVAIGGGKGLVVPVLRNAEHLSFAEVEKGIADFGARAKENKLKIEELQGGTFTISNGGVYGSLLSTPIVNPPQSGVLGLHAIQERPIAVNGAVVIRPMMYVALTYDHRLVDGREAVTFLKRVKDTMETLARMLIEV